MRIAEASVLMNRGRPIVEKTVTLCSAAESVTGPVTVTARGAGNPPTSSHRTMPTTSFAGQIETRLRTRTQPTVFQNC